MEVVRRDDTAADVVAPAPNSQGFAAGEFDELVRPEKMLGPA